MENFALTPPKIGTRDNSIKASKINEKHKSTQGIQNDTIEINQTRTKITEQRTNLREILTCSNATPFVGVNCQGYMCGYCDAQYPDPGDLKKHTRGNHKGLYNAVTPKTYKSKNKPEEFCVKLDITDLRCTLCDTDMDTLENLMKHLETDHKRGMHTDIQHHLLPFKFIGDTMKCCMCPNFYRKFRSLHEHMRIHYRNYVCDVCDKGYFTKSCLRSHMATHITGVFKCGLCPKTFLTKARANYHETSVHVNKGMNLKCGFCYEKFRNYMRRDEHLAAVHGVKLKIVNCLACTRTFPNRSALRIHTRRDHLMERRFKCTECDKAFFQSADLKFHMVTHTKTRDFQCTVCLKSYSRKETLRQHMEIHSEVRRFKCERCGQAFVQKASWKGHMKSKHSELV